MAIATQKLLWASVHKPQPEQLEELNKLGDVVYLDDTYPDISNTPDESDAAEKLAEEFIRACVSSGATWVVQPAGSPRFQFLLGKLSQNFGVEVTFLFANSKRVSEERTKPDGSVEKVSIFKHTGFSKG